MNRIWLVVEWVNSFTIKFINKNCAVFDIHFETLQKTVFSVSIVLDFAHTYVCL